MRTFNKKTGETQMKLIQDLCATNLSEPYSVFTYRYFVNKWPYLTYLAISRKVLLPKYLIIFQIYGTF